MTGLLIVLDKKRRREVISFIAKVFLDACLGHGIFICVMKRFLSESLFWGRVKSSYREEHHNRFDVPVW